MTVRLAINGFGRIGRTVLRALLASGQTDMQVVALNDPAPADTLAHLLEFDSLHGRLPLPVKLDGANLMLGNAALRITAHEDPADLQWADVDIALECSGKFLAPAASRRHLENGTRRVLLSAPAKGAGKTIVFGVNDARITAEDVILSNGSCTTNCLVPVAHVLHEALQIKRGMMTTVHSYTSTQPTHDSPHADLYRARAAALSMIPTSTGAASTLGQVIPALEGRITGQAIRVPAPNVSCIDLTVEVARSVSVDAVNAIFREASATAFKDIIATTDRKLVSSDFRQDPHSAILAVDQTRVQDGNLVRILAWYDNEWGFSNRMLDTARRMGRLL
ncbi:type I glyceraldehyde-3-phosphate dehydrogenase [Roseobacter sp. YSTF-M11]|uniref:Type I glyceraldehyde-3-phosphate dehydrogenase n=1 Tax=Roseobacter insulae TaxID=2859783 RepID=A0A9X1FVN2_9RHOB|nr:type I glyceraldehyde-3-phosphate dehydrogenase [Roseobacter insulae]MBW4708576.1 type I glyceraldehyde-3-phosphate dehydrogenase [Roseobacter insulae]